MAGTRRGGGAVQGGGGAMQRDVRRGPGLRRCRLGGADCSGGDMCCGGAGRAARTAAAPAAVRDALVARTAAVVAVQAGRAGGGRRGMGELEDAGLGMLRVCLFIFFSGSCVCSSVC